VFADWDEELESDNFDQFDQLVENNDVTGLIDALRHPDPDWRLKALMEILPPPALLLPPATTSSLP